MDNKTIKTRLLLISDTHNTPPYPPPTPHPYRHPLPIAHILIHSGDLTTIGSYKEHTTALAVLKAHPAELKLIIAGNHDITLDEEYYAALPATSFKTRSGREDPAAIKQLYCGPEAYDAGIRYLDEGLYCFTLSTGAKVRVFASPYTPEFCGWAFAYPRGRDRFNPLPEGADAAVAGASVVPDFPSVDIMITHGPPAGVLDTVVNGGSVGCEGLFAAVKRARPRVHVFGHIHEGYGALRGEWGADMTLGGTKVVCDEDRVREERGAYVDVSADSGRPLRFGEETLFVNASVLNERYRAVNAPWVVDLDLPVAS
ncbi:metallophosphoesterase domain-containing protein 1 [Aspergillus lentulus]|uniref:metallophosphatase domain-containing protein n=1 Tax=Aspergillus lentulus TaxID=293939 RepID=UPI0013926402|nr:metallophosphoesterase domain-containing protein 1 [Aspergillus lentulus]GFF33102.1 metallophosphoesterase domain-containing protein 1 [Aspergillus lentulus]